MKDNKGENKPSLTAEEIIRKYSEYSDISIDEAINAMEEYAAQELSKARANGITDNKSGLPDRFMFSNEHGNDVVVLATVGEWCMVIEEEKKKPYILPLEFVIDIYIGK
jgi:hypothetical protein